MQFKISPSTSDKTGVMGELCRIIRHLGSRIQRAGSLLSGNQKRFSRAVTTLDLERPSVYIQKTTGLPSGRA